MSIAERREAVQFLEEYGVSVQRACVLVRFNRSTFLYQARPLANDGVLAWIIHEHLEGPNTVRSGEQSANCS